MMSVVSKTDVTSVIRTSSSIIRVSSVVLTMALLGVVAGAYYTDMYGLEHYRFYGMDSIFLGSQNVTMQRSDFDCGIASLSMVARTHGVWIDPLDLMAEHDDGKMLSLAELVQIAASHGLSVHGVMTDATGMRRLPVPWIAHLMTRRGHFVVVEEIRQDRWIVADPSMGRVSISERVFLSRWSGYALVVD